VTLFFILYFISKLWQTYPNFKVIALYGHSSLHFKHKLHSPLPVKNSKGSSKILICFGQTFSQIPQSDLPTHLTGLLESFKNEYSLIVEATAPNGQKYLQYTLGYHIDKIMRIK